MVIEFVDERCWNFIQ